jgi:hypothetical protein
MAICGAKPIGLGKTRYRDATITNKTKLMIRFLLNFMKYPLEQQK